MNEDLPKEEVKAEAPIFDAPKPEEKTPKKNNSRKLILFGILGVLILILVVMVGWSMRPTKLTYDSNSETAKYLDGEEKEVVPNTKPVQKLNTTDPIVMLNSLRGYAEISQQVDEAMFYYPFKESENEWSSGKRIYINQTDLVRYDKAKMSKNIEYFFSKQGFLKSEERSINRTIGYYLGDTLCLAPLQDANDYIIYCGKLDNNYNVLLSELTPVVRNDPHFKGKLPPEYVKIEIERSEGDFVVGVYQNHFVAKKENSKWKILYFALESPFCKDVEKYNIPKGIDNCYLEDGKTFKY